MSLVDDCGLVVDLVTTTEGVTIPPTARARLANAMAAGIEKAILLGWHKDATTMTDAPVANAGIIRAAERGARRVDR